MFDELIKNLKENTAFSDEEVMQVLICGYRKTYKKNEFIFSPGDKCLQHFYINSGLVRCYCKLTKKEITLNIWCEDSWFTDYIALFHQEPTQYYFQAIEDLEVFVIDDDKMQELYSKNGNFEKWGFSMAEKRAMELLLREQPDKMNTPEEHYKIFLENNPKIAAKTPLKYLASLINIEPETLSRIRRKIVKE